MLPLIRARWPGAGATVRTCGAATQRGALLLDRLARTDVGRASHGAQLAAPALRALSPERRRDALRYWIAAAGFTVRRRVA